MWSKNKIGAIQRDFVCWASDLELDPKVMGALVKGGVVSVRSDVCSLEKHRAVSVCSGETAPAPWTLPSVLERGHGHAPYEDDTCRK